MYANSYDTLSFTLQISFPSLKDLGMHILKKNFCWIFSLISVLFYKEKFSEFKGVEIRIEKQPGQFSCTKILIISNSKIRGNKVKIFIIFIPKIF